MSTVVPLKDQGRKEEEQPIHFIPPTGKGKGPELGGAGDFYFYLCFYIITAGCQVLGTLFSLSLIFGNPMRQGLLSFARGEIRTQYVSCTSRHGRQEQDVSDCEARTFHSYTVLPLCPMSL